MQYIKSVFCILFQIQNFRPDSSKLVFGCFVFNAVDDVVRNL